MTRDVLGKKTVTQAEDGAPFRLIYQYRSNAEVDGHR